MFKINRNTTDLHCRACVGLLRGLLTVAPVLVLGGYRQVYTYKKNLQGDSGGPLNYQGTTVGVTSYVSGEGCESGEPDAFTEVAWFNSEPGGWWIYENTNGTVGQAPSK